MYREQLVIKLAYFVVSPFSIKPQYLRVSFEHPIRPDTLYLKGQGNFPWQRAPLCGICTFLLGLLKGHQGKDQGQRRQLPLLPPLNIRPALFSKWTPSFICHTHVQNLDALFFK